MLGLIAVVVVIGLLMYISHLQSRLDDAEQEARGEPSWFDLYTGDPKALEWHEQKMELEALERGVREGDERAKRMLQLRQMIDQREALIREAEKLRERQPPMKDSNDQEPENDAPGPLGQCPECGEQVTEMLTAGNWDGIDDEGWPTGGAMYSATCTACKSQLGSAGSYSAEPAELEWRIQRA